MAKRIAALICAVGLSAAGPSFAQDDEISITPLDAVRQDAAGLLPESVSGIPRGFWGDSAPATLRGLMPLYEKSALPEAKSLMLRIVLAQVDPPKGDAATANILLSRLDYLISSGALDQADALLSAVGGAEPELFNRWFDTNLMLRQPDRACSPAAENPALIADLPRRVFCLAQLGDWSAAAVALQLGGTLGEIEPELTDLLSIFLDREEFEGIDIRSSPNRSPLKFYLRQSLDAPAPVRARSLPLPYLSYLLGGYDTWKDRLYAAERLTASAATSPNYLLSLYREGTPSASGGVWERVDAVQDLFDAISAGQDDIEAELNRAWAELSPRGLCPALAELVVAELSQKPNLPYGGAALTWLAVLAEDSSLADLLLEKGQSTPWLRAITTENFADVTPSTAIETAIFDALTGDPPPDVLQQLLDTNRQGEAVLRALGSLSQGVESDPQDIRAGLATLMRAGFATEAQRISQQLIIFSNAKRL